MRVMYERAREKKSAARENMGVANSISPILTSRRVRRSVSARDRVDVLERHRRQPGKAELVRGRRRHVDDAALGERPAIIDAHDHPFSVAAIDDPYLGTE